MGQYDPKFDLIINVGPTYHSPVILLYILKSIWCMNIILMIYESRFGTKIYVGYIDLHF